MVMSPSALCCIEMLDLLNECVPFYNLLRRHTICDPRSFSTAVHGLVPAADEGTDNGAAARNARALVWVNDRLV